MLDFIKTNYAEILMIIIAIAGIFFGLRSKYAAQVKQGLLFLVTEAERQFGGGTGQLKFAAVSNWAYEKLPAFARFFLSANVIDSMIENAVMAMKELLKGNISVAAFVETPLQSTAITQNITNYAPVNMSRSDVYRQTTNQIADTEDK